MATKSPLSNPLFKTYRINLKEKNTFTKKKDTRVYFVKEYNYGVHPTDYVSNNMVDKSNYVYKQLGKYEGMSQGIIKYYDEPIATDTYLLFEKYLVILMGNSNNAQISKKDFWTNRLDVIKTWLATRLVDRLNILSNPKYTGDNIMFDQGYEYYTGDLIINSTFIDDLIVFNDDPKYAYCVTDVHPKTNKIIASVDGKNMFEIDTTTGEKIIFTTNNITGGKHKTKYNKRKSAKKQTRKHLRRRSRR